MGKRKEGKEGRRGGKEGGREGGREGWMEGWTDGRTDGWTDGRTDGQTDGQTEGRKEGRKEGGKAKVEYVKDHLKIRMFVFLDPQPLVLILGPWPLGPQNIARMNKAYYLFKIILIQH